MKRTAGYRAALWLLLLVLVGQALGIRPEYLVGPMAQGDAAGLSVLDASSQHHHFLSVVRSGTGAQYDWAITEIECKEVEEDEESSAASKDLRGVHTRSSDLLAGIAARYVATLPWEQGREARVPSISRHLLLGVVRV